MKGNRHYSAEVRERAVFMVFEHRHEHLSQWAAIKDISSGVGCAATTLRRWVKLSENDQSVNMNNELLHLHKLPFENVPDPEFYFDRGGYGKALRNICDSIDAGRGLMVVTGPIGSGKTTLSQMVMQRFEDRLNLIWMAEPPKNEIDILAFLGKELGIHSAGEGRVFLIDDIRNTLAQSEKRHLFILDEAHLMSDEVAGTLKTLNNLEMKSRKLIQMLLLGQDELHELINKPEMAPFKQRIATLEVIGRMERRDIRNYIEHRLAAAGGGPDIFSDEAIEAIAFGSGGVPRLINTLCGKALSCAHSRDSQAVGVEDVYDAAEGVIERKDIFQLMLSTKNRGGDGAEAGQGQAAKDTAAGVSGGNGARQHGESGSLGNIFDSPEEFDAWIRQDDKTRNKGGLTWPLWHLLISSAVLAVSVLYFLNYADVSVEQLLYWLPISG